MYNLFKVCIQLTISKGEYFMKKLNYTAPELSIRFFADDEVITASTSKPTRDEDAPIELPFVPAG